MSKKRSQKTFGSCQPAEPAANGEPISPAQSPEDFVFVSAVMRIPGPVDTCWYVCIARCPRCWSMSFKGVLLRKYDTNASVLFADNEKDARRQAADLVPPVLVGVARLTVQTGDVVEAVNGALAFVPSRTEYRL